MQSAAVPVAARDSDIHTLVQSGAHAAAFAQLLERYQGKVYRLCCVLLRDSAQAEDAAQESLVRIWRALPGYDGRASLSSWIFTITRNRCLTAIERRRDEVALDEEIQEVEERTQTRDAEPDDTHELLRELVGALPERYRRVLTLFYYEDRSVSEVAEMLAMPEGTVKTTLFRARALLAEQLKRRGLHDARLWLGVSS
ncbi:MAG TPA: sigma-70 family RNA polymerase sigma factor [Steroidobacteraceae bacterium]|nr:sigma-70 family RNA polymerase sigma factor [Steroidobacteraceae bacterium]